MNRFYKNLYLSKWITCFVVGIFTIGIGLLFIQHVLASDCDGMYNEWGRDECTGYFTGSTHINGTGDNVFADPALNNVYDKTTFINTMQNYLNSGDSRTAGGAAFTIDVMLGLKGTSFNTIDQGVQYAKNNFNRWVNIVNYYDSQNLIDWDYSLAMSPPFLNTGYSNSSKDNYAITDEINTTFDVIRFRNPDGNPDHDFTIEKMCGNIKGIDGFITQSVNQITGNVFIDNNANGIKDAGESNYNGTISISSSQGTVSTTTGGTFVINNLSSGNTIISYNNLAAGYKMVTPLNGPPPSYSVQTGSPCNTNGAPGASCNNGNISSLNFGITDYDPWMQFTCGSVRMDAGITNQVPSTAKTSPYTIQTSPLCSNPGVFISGNSTPTLGTAGISAKNYLAGGTGYPETYNGSSGHLSTSCDVLQAKAYKNKLQINDLNTVCNTSSCTLPANLPHGIWQANGNLTLNAFTVPANNNYVFFVNGSTQINGTISAPQGNNNSFMICSKDNISVTSSVGVASTVATSSLDGIFTTDKSFIINSANNCNDLRLNITGAIITNAGRGGGTLQNNRDLCVNNSFYPTFTVSQRADLLLNLPDLLRQEQSSTSEVAP